ncbi:MAG TPA: hypothetical protein VHQ90_08320 [Thermoanaerobaculia bacterium]|nr:hypothetical protein [Thermoanaerobaculia bacterium]
MSRLSEREVGKRLAEHARREGGAPPPELLARLRADIPPAVAAAPDLAETGRPEAPHPIDSRRLPGGAAPRRWLIAATLAASVGAGVVAVRVMERTLAKNESWAAPPARLAREGPRPHPGPASPLPGYAASGPPATAPPIPRPNAAAQLKPPAATPLVPRPMARAASPAATSPAGAVRRLAAGAAAGGEPPGQSAGIAADRSATPPPTRGAGPDRAGAGEAMAKAMALDRLDQPGGRPLAAPEPAAAPAAPSGPRGAAGSAGAAQEELNETLTVLSEAPLQDARRERAKSAVAGAAAARVSSAPGAAADLLIATLLAPRSAVELRQEPSPGSYARVRRALLEERRLPSAATVRPEDLVAAFAISEPPSPAADGFLIGAEGAPSPALAGERYILRLRLRAGQAGATAPQSAAPGPGAPRLAVTFNPEAVAGYRLLGTAAGKPPGQESIALYEIALAPGAAAADRRTLLATLDASGVSADGVAGKGQAGTVRLSALRPSWEEASPAFRLNAIAAELAVLLSGRAMRSEPADLLRRARDLRRDLPGDSRLAELIRLIERTASLTRAAPP